MTNEPPKLALIEQEKEPQWKLEEIFLPQAARLRSKLFMAGQASGPVRFVHYTSAEAALNIIKTKRVWMRNATCMTDYREVQHGYDILFRFFSVAEKRDAFLKALDAPVPGAATEAIKLFDGWWNTIRFNTYIAAISEHDGSEDFHGRLSMWRAYGGRSARVAIVFSLPYDSNGPKALKILFNPIMYADEMGAHGFFEEAIQNINANHDYLKNVPRELVVSWAFTMLLVNVTCLKHPGFKEEREWRAVYCPKFSASPGLMKNSIQSVGGIPQTVYELPLDGKMDPVLEDIDFCKLFDRLIIGPSQYSFALAEAFHAALLEAGVPDAGQHVFISEIPIRT
jgi:Protein of unknown function (DUF2971)